MNEQQYGLVFTTLFGWAQRPGDRCGLPSIAVKGETRRPPCPEHVKATVALRRARRTAALPSAAAVIERVDHILSETRRPPHQHHGVSRERFAVSRKYDSIVSQ